MQGRGVSLVWEPILSLCLERCLEIVLRLKPGFGLVVKAVFGEEASGARCLQSKVTSWKDLERASTLVRLGWAGGRDVR